MIQHDQKTAKHTDNFSLYHKLSYDTQRDLSDRAEKHLTQIINIAMKLEDDEEAGTTYHTITGKRCEESNIGNYEDKKVRE